MICLDLESCSCLSGIWLKIDNCILGTPKPCGLRSTLKGSYMNSVSHAAASSGIFIKELKRLQSMHPNSSKLNTFLALLLDINGIPYSNTNILKNTKSHENVVEAVRLNRASEKDVFKWFANLINAIEEEVNSLCSERIKMPMKIRLVQRYKGSDIPDELYDHFGISLNLCGDYLNKPGVKLEFLINKYFQSQTSHDDPSKAYQRYFYKEAPDILLLHILSYKWDTLADELSNPVFHIKYDQQMTLRFDIVTELNTEKMKRGNFDYRICSVIHYIWDRPKKPRVAYRFWKDGWYIVNNRQVEKSKFKNNRCPYILIYERQTEKVDEASPSGLLNTSTTCYMNAMVQAVASSDVFVEELEKLQSLNLRSPSLNYFLRLLHGINEGDSLSLNTELLKNLVEEVHWNKPSEEDAFQLFSALINGIHKEMKSTFSEPFEMPAKFKLIHRFQGVDFDDKVQDHLGLSLGLFGSYSDKPGVTLEFLIQGYFQPTIIDDDPSKCTQMLFYKEAPDMLLLHIQANKWDNVQGEMFKPEYHIIYNQEMIIEVSIATDIDIKEAKTEICHYTLKGVVEHMGSISGGHYVTYRLCNDYWYLLNDVQVTKVTFNNNICPYILIYERKKPM